MTADTTPLSHDEAVELLEDHVDGRLGPVDAARVDAHVADCEECVAILGPVAPVDLGTTAPTMDERSMRRSVRRTLLGVAGRAAGILVLLLLVAVLGSSLLVQPLLLGGDRTAALARATYELPTLVHPGTTVEEFRIESGAQTRTFTTTLHLPVGSSTIELGTVSSQRRLLGSDTPLWPFVDGWDPNPVPARDVLERLGRTSVATVAMQLPTPLVIDDAQALADDLAPGVSTVWAGFDLAGITDELAVTDPLAMVGASTCSAPLPSAQLFGATSADAGGSFGAAPTSISDALDAVRETVSHVAAHPELAALLPAGWFDTLSVHDDALGASDPTVSMLVVTGPTDVLVEALDTAGAIDAQVLATATYDWIGPVCR